MYGYTALKKGSVWQFVVKVDETISSEDEKLIIETLEESKRLGKSKSAEYGEVEITYFPNATVENIATVQNDEVVLYCNSRLALVDDNGNPTYDLKYLCDGVKIVYEKTQIRISTFTPYNGARKTKDYERVCINKGSVIVIKNPTKSQLETIQKGVGAFLSEGFGEILINPSFLMEQKFELKKYEKKKEKEKVAITEDVVKFLAQREKTKNEMLDIAKEVAKFIEDHKKPTFSNIKSSQWDNIRSIATSNQKNWLNNIEEYVSSGAKKWEVQQSTTLLNAINTHTIDQQKFTKLLAMKMGGKND